ncbi:MAG: acetyl-CoA acetyltransferase [marine bacterium B5-7]|nr:MAG: acetyl-CoA acetyltransferase [marine bacterium B5-7]
MNDDPVVIVSAKRTPMGGFLGVLTPLAGPSLGSSAIRAALEAADIDNDSVEEVTMGCVLPAGLGQAPARQASLGAGIPLSANCTTVNKMCGSGMKAAMLAHDTLIAGSNRIMVAGGMESMSNAPYLLDRARGGYRLGHGAVKDHMFLDGLEDAYEPGKLMGAFAEDTASHYGFTRERQDEFAIASLTRAKSAIDEGRFDDEVVPVQVVTRREEIEVAHDEQPHKANIDKIPSLKPAFSKNGTVTPANSSSISDGAAALVMMRASTAESLGLSPLARVVGHASHAREPKWFTTAPVGAMQTLMEQIGWSVKDVDLWEINEAFAVVTLAAIDQLKLDHQQVNVNGGACALGHPIGASGARIVTTLLHALKQRGERRGIASLCIGGGEATAMAFELV